MVVRSDVLIGRRYLAIRRAKQKAQIRSRQRKICRRAMSAGTHCRRRRVGRRNGGGPLAQAESNLSLRRARPTSKCLGVPPRAIIPSPGERFHHEKTGSERIRGLLRELYIESPGVGRMSLPRTAPTASV